MASAGDKAAPQAEQPLGFQPTPGMITLGTLGSYGLLAPLLSDDLEGLQMARIGASRTTINFMKASPVGTEPPPFRDRDWAVIAPVSVMKELPSWGGGANFARFTFSGNYGEGHHADAFDNTGQVYTASAMFLHAPDPKTIYGLGVTYENSDVVQELNNLPLGSDGTVKREAWGIKALFGHEFDDHWGITAKAEYQKGTSNLYIKQFVAPGVSIPINTVDQGDDRLYLETQVVGTYDDKYRWVPGGWVVHPVVGATFQRNFIEEVNSSLGFPVSGSVGKTEDYGLLLAKVGIEKAVAPTPDWQFLPSASLGFQYEYTDSLDIYLKERTYATGTVGLGVMKFGQRLDFQYSLNQGLTGKRAIQAFALVTSISF